MCRHKIGNNVKKYTFGHTNLDNPDPELFQRETHECSFVIMYFISSTCVVSGKRSPAVTATAIYITLPTTYDVRPGVTSTLGE